MHNTAARFVLLAIQECGQSEEVRIGAVQAVLDIAGIDAKARGWPVFGGVWNKKCEGPEEAEADSFLKGLTDSMRRGKFEDEVAHVEAKIKEHQAKRGAQAQR